MESPDRHSLAVPLVRQRPILQRMALTIRNLRQLRERAVMTQAQLAAAAGLSRHTVQQLESGVRPAYPTTVQKLARALKVKPADLVGEAN